MRYTLQAWWCWGCKTKNLPEDRECTGCGSNRIQRNASVHSSERAVIFRNPATGERRVPARADQPIPDVYAQQGFERVEINSMIEYERQTRTVHEASNFHPGNEPVLPEAPAPQMSPEIRTDLVNELRAMITSGPITMREDPNSLPPE